MIEDKYKKKTVKQKLAEGHKKQITERLNKQILSSPKKNKKENIF